MAFWRYILSSSTKTTLILKPLILFTLAIFVIFQASPSGAQNKELVPDKIEEIKKIELGWTNSLKLTAQASVNSSQNVVGQTDGDSKTFGADLKGKFNFKDKSREWRNEFSLEGATTSTPALPQFVKSSDVLKLSSLFLKSLESYKWMGPYGKFSLNTNVFSGNDVRATPATYNVSDKDGNALPLLSRTNANDIHLIDGFGVITLKESVGFFAKPTLQPHHTLEFRAGLGAIQVVTDKQFSITDDTNNVVTVSEIPSYTEVGFETAVGYKQKLNKTSNLSFDFEALYPFSPEKTVALAGYDDVEFTNIESSFSIESKISAWASMKFEYKALRQLKVTPDWQIQQNFSFNFTHELL